MLEDAAISAEINRIDQLFGAGRRPEAEDVCRRLLDAAPSSGVAWFRLGLLLLDRQAYAEAESALRQALVHEPHAAVIWCQLGLAVQRQGLAVEAEDAVRRALALEPTHPAHWNALGSVLYDQRRHDAACEAHRQSLAIDPRNPTVWNDLGIAEQARSHFAEAEQAFQNSLALAAGHPGALVNYAFLLCQQGQQDRAFQLLQPMIVRDPSSSSGWLMLGEIFEAMVQSKLAATAYRRAWELAPHEAQAGFRLAKMLQSNHQLTEAERVLRAHLTRFPEQADSVALLGEVLMRQCRTAEGLKLAERAVRLSPDPHRHSRLLLELQYDDDISPERLLAAHRDWNNAYAKALMPTTPRERRLRRNSPLRIGLVSKEFGQTPAAFLVLPALEHLPRTDCELICYSDRTNDDEYTTRFRAAATAWRTTYGHPDEQVATLIKRDNIDVLIDLMGHTGRRLLLFARQPAPFQLSWLGYASTTGMSAIDGILADRFHVRAGEDNKHSEERWYSEHVYRLPNGYACYGPPRNSPAVNPLPALAAGHVTFGCFNNTLKYSVKIREAWAKILRRVPTSRLMLKFQGLDDQQLQTNLRQWFVERGVTGDRIVFEGWSLQADLLATYNRIDLALDTQPYSGGLTTCDSLWMGVPVITFPGHTFAGRHSTSYLTNAGYPQFIAADINAYIELAVEWAHRLDDLAKIRRALRNQFQSSPVCNAPQFARDFLSVITAAQ